ncbi:MAG: glycoside hydrolase family 99-like domain-containing protein [Monoglobales bacterium]
MKEYDVAAYVWPAYAGDCPQTRIFWEQGMGEWQTVQSAKSKFEGHRWPRRPLWGYVNEADSYVMEMEIEAATDHGINTFIYDWYWYDNRPYLQQCLENGFLKAKNRDKMKFYIMWANHDVNFLWDKRNSDAAMENNILYSGRHSQHDFECATDYIIEKYFYLDNYYKIDGKPVFAIYQLTNTIEGLGGIENTKKAIDIFREKVIKAGLPGVHLQVLMQGDGNLPVNLDGLGAPKNIDLIPTAEELGFDSVTHYQFTGMVDIDAEYQDIIPKVVDCWNEIKGKTKMTYYPHVSLGWDNNVRFEKGCSRRVLRNNTPENIEKMMLEAKKFADGNEIPLITVNSWNEWTEGSYLEPDDLYGYGYLEAVKKVFSD